jgi:hypothetical protein
MRRLFLALHLTAHRFALLLGLAAATAAAGCSGVEPGDYVVYRVATSTADLSDGCYWQFHGDDANVVHDSSTMRQSSLFVLYAGIEESFLLDVGSAVLEGENVADEDYEFSGKATDVTWSNPNGSGTKNVTTVTMNVGMTVDGALVTGTLDQKTSWGCSGSGCGDLPPSCTQKIDFVGIEVEDVQLEHGVAGDGPDLAGPGNTGNNNSGSGGGGGGGGGEGGAGGGGTGACYGCAYMLSASEITYADLCADSQAIFDSMATCACETTCSDICLDTMCSESPATNECASCAYDTCTDSANACLADTQSPQS